MQPRGRKRELRGDIRQKELLDALRDALESGVSFAELSIEDLTGRAGLSRPSFYFYFESKQQALMAALVEVREEMLGRAQVFLHGSSPNPMQEIQDAISGVVQVWRENQSLMRALVEAAATDKEVWKGLVEFIEAFVEPTASRVVQVWKAQGHEMPISAARELCTILLWSNERNFYRATVSDFDESRWEALAHTITAIWAGVILSPSLKEHFRENSRI